MQFNDYLNEIYIHQKNNFDIVYYHSYDLSNDSIQNALKKLTEFMVFIICFKDGTFQMYEYDIHQDNFILSGQSELNQFNGILFTSQPNMNEFITKHISNIYGTW